MFSVRESGLKSNGKQKKKCVNSVFFFKSSSAEFVVYYFFDETHTHTDIYGKK